MTYHDNDVTIDLDVSGLSIETGSYTISDFKVSDGQDPDGKIYKGLVASFGSNGTMTFKVGRHGTSSVADWFKDEFSADQTTFGHDPDDLNFAFIGTLVMELSDGNTYTYENVGLAQGHSGASNNWWFASQSGIYIGSDELVFAGTRSNGGSALTTKAERGGNSVSTVEFKTISG